MSETVELRYVVDGDASGAVGALGKASDAADDVDDKFRKASEGVGSGFDRVGEHADTAEQRAMGFSDALMGAQDTMAGFGALLHDVPNDGKGMTDYLALTAQGFAGLASGAANLVIPLASSAASLKAFSLSAVTSRVSSIAASVASKAWAAGQWLLNAALTANPIGLVIVAIVALVAAIVIAYKKSDTFRAIVQAAMRGAVVAFGWVLSKVTQLVGWIRSNWPLLLAILTGPIGLAVRWILQHWDQIKSGVVSKTTALIAWIRGLPGRILSALGNLGSLLLGAGGRVIQGFLDGIQRGFDRVRSKLRELTNLLPDWKGPARVDASILYDSGGLVAGGFEQGFVDRFTGKTRTAMGDLTRSLPDAVATAGGGTGGRREMHVHVHTPAVITTHRQLLELIDQAERSVELGGTYVRPMARLGS